MREATKINTSMLALEKCMQALQRNAQTGSKGYVPYRGDKLTELFQVYFEGHGQAVRLCFFGASCYLDPFGPHRLHTRAA